MAAVDADVVIPLGKSSAPDDGGASANPELAFGTTLRAGYQLSFVIVDISLEGGVRSLKFSPDDPLMAIYGGRVNVGKLIKPGIYAHGIYSFDGASGWEAGLTGDFTAIPVVKFGLQLGYGEMTDVEWLNAGVHIAAQF